LRNSLGQSKKTEIRNIFIPSDGKMDITKTGANALAYNQTTLIMGLLFKNILPESLNQIFGDNATFKQQLISSLYVKFQEERIGSIFREGGFSNPTEALLTGNWIHQNNLDKLMEIAYTVIAEASINSVSQTVINEQILSKSLGFWVGAAEIFATGGNTFLQWFDWYKAQEIRTTN
jgi:hypothetical protein